MTPEVDRMARARRIYRMLQEIGPTGERAQCELLARALAALTPGTADDLATGLLGDLLYGPVMPPLLEKALGETRS